MSSKSKTKGKNSKTNTKTHIDSEGRNIDPFDLIDDSDYDSDSSMREETSLMVRLSENPYALHDSDRNCDEDVISSEQSLTKENNPFNLYDSDNEREADDVVETKTKSKKEYKKNAKVTKKITRKGGKKQTKTASK